jgi:hypothetical protein
VNVSQCDNCKRIAEAPPPSTWPVVMTMQEPQHQLMSFLGGSSGGPEIAGMFCSWRCLGEYASTRALVGEVKPGESP